MISGIGTDIIDDHRLTRRNAANNLPTGDVQKETYVYYRFTGNRDKCDLSRSECRVRTSSKERNWMNGRP
jgi:hypothetical protein